MSATLRGLDWEKQGGRGGMGLCDCVRVDVDCNVFVRVFPDHSTWMSQKFSAMFCLKSPDPSGELQPAVSTDSNETCARFPHQVRQNARNKLHYKSEEQERL